MKETSFLRTDCPVCASRRLGYAFSHAGYRIARCTDCGVMFSNPQPTDEQLTEIYNADYFLGAGSADGQAATREMKRATARLYLEEINRYCGAASGRLLEVGCGDGDFLVEAEAAGFQVTGVELAAPACEQARVRLKSGEVICGLLESSGLPEEQFDLCVLSDVIEHVRDPLAFLANVRRLLKPNGAIFIATPSLASWSAKLLRQNWMEFKPEHLTYFDPKTLETALFRTGYHEVIVQPGWKILSFEYVAQHFERFPVPVVTPLVRFVRNLLPQKTREKYRRVVASGMMVFGRRATVPEKRKLSVVLPAYNEAATFEPLMEAVLHKEVPFGLDIEVVVVESNSTDGTRQLAQKYQDHPRVRLGAGGQAVRQGACGPHRTRPCAGRFHFDPGCRPRVRSRGTMMPCLNRWSPAAKLLPWEPAMAARPGRCGDLAISRRSAVCSTSRTGASPRSSTCASCNGSKGPVYDGIKCFAAELPVRASVGVQPVRFRLGIADQTFAEGLQAAGDAGELPLPLVQGGQKSDALR